jgi:hypothetical protein
MIYTMAGAPLRATSKDLPSMSNLRVAPNVLEGVRGCTCWDGVRVGSMPAGERGMSDTGIWGPCGHNWLDFACYAAGALDDGKEVRAVEVQAVVCAACSDELGDLVEVAGLIYEAVDVAPASVWRPRPR